MKTIAEQKRTCSYCLRYFPTQERFNQHFKKCQSRHLDKQDPVVNLEEGMIESYEIWDEGWYVEEM